MAAERASDGLAGRAIAGKGAPLAVVLGRAAKTAAVVALVVVGGCKRGAPGEPPRASKRAIEHGASGASGASARTGSGTGSGTAAAAAGSAGAAQRLGGAKPTLLVGMLTREGLRHCLAGNKVQWLHEHWEVGFIWVLGGGSVGFDKLKNRAVVVEGSRAKRPATPMPKSGAVCPPMQMRSDWVVSMNGIRRKRGGGGLSPLRAFTARKVSAFTGLTVKREGDKLVGKLSNTLGRDLRGVVVRVHYEGCYGKPGHRQREHKAATLAAGKSTSLSFPTYVDGAGRGAHRASSVQIVAGGDKVVFDFDLSLHRLSPPVKVDCPRPGRKR